MKLKFFPSYTCQSPSEKKNATPSLQEFEGDLIKELLATLWGGLRDTPPNTHARVHTHACTHTRQYSRASNILGVIISA